MTNKKTVLDLLKAQQVLLRRGISIITPVEFARLFKKTPRESLALLHVAIKNDVMFRIKRGIYFLNANPPSAFEVANVLYSPSYISLETALSYHRLIPEVVYEVTSLTTKITARFERLNRSFVYSKINPRLFFGYKKMIIGNKNILIAEKEKALLDYLYFVAAGRKSINDRLDISKINRVALQDHLPYFRDAIKGKKLKIFNSLLSKYNI